MTKYEVLTQLNTKMMTPKEAYQLLFSQTSERKPKRAGFIVIRIKIPESKGATLLLRFLLFLPIPIFLAKLFVPKKIKNQEGALNDQIPVTPKELIELVSLKGVKVDVETKDKVKVLIKTI